MRELNNYLDRLYVHRDYQRRGIATALCDELEKHSNKIVVTHASITARPFFEHRGYKVIKEQQVERRDVLLTNFVMQKIGENNDCINGKYEIDIDLQKGVNPML